MVFLRLFILVVLVVSVAVGSKLPPAPPIWDGNDGLQPPLTLYFSDYSEGPVTPAVAKTIGGVLWKIEEGWDSKNPGRPRVKISRTRLLSHQTAILAVAYPDDSNRYLAFRRNDDKWDATPALGSHSLTYIDAGGSFEAIWFVQDKELVGVTYTSIVLSPADRPARHQKVLQIARAVQAKIVATGESGGDDNRGHGNDPDHVDEDNPGKGSGKPK